MKKNYNLSLYSKDSTNFNERMPEVFRRLAVPKALTISLLILLTFGLSFNTYSQIGTVQVGSGILTTTAMPVTIYDYTYSQQIVTAAEYGAGGGAAGNITKIRYKFTSIGSPSVYDNWTVYLANTAKTSFTSDTDWLPLAQLTQVFTGTIVPIANNWFEIVLTVPFNYTGGNMIVAVDENSAGWSGSPTIQAYTSTANSGIVFRADGTNTDPATPPSATSRLNILPQIQFEGTLASCPPPNTLTVNTLTANSANLSWTGVGPATDFDVEFGPIGFTPTGVPTDASVANNFTKGGLTPSTYYQYYVRAVCSPVDQSIWNGPYTFTTLQIPAIVPFTDDFSTSLWTLVNGTQTNQWFIGAAAGNPANGMYVSNDNGVTNAYTISSNSVVQAYRDITFPAGLNTFNLSFDWKAFGESSWDYLRVWMVPSTATINSGTQISALNTTGAIQLGGNLNQSATWVIGQNFIIPASYAGTNARLVFEWRNDGSGGTQDPIAIDNVQMTVITCPAPTALVTSNATTTTMDLAWVENGSSTDWEISYGIGNFNPNAGTIVTGVTNPVTITGLLPSSTYKFYVRSKCSASDSSTWFGPVNGITLCAPITALPWTENFDNLTTVGTIFPPCWLNENPGDWTTTNDAASTLTAGPLSGANYLRINYTSNATMWTPEFSLIAGETYELTFNWAGDGYDAWDGAVYVNGSQSITGAITLGTKFIENGDATTLTYQKETYCFTPTTSGVYAFGVKVIETGNNWYMSFDDFQLKQVVTVPGTDGSLSACQTGSPVDLNTVITTAVTDGSWNFNLNPSAINSAGMFNANSVPSGVHQFYYISAGCAPDTTVATITVFPASSAGNDGSIAVCRNQPFNLLSGLTGSADFGGVWTNPNAVVVPNGNAIASNIPGQYNYKYIVTNGVCPADTAKVVVNVQGCDYLGLEDVVFEGFNMYPNPTSDMVFISNSGSTEVFNYEVLDMNGRVILKANQAINGSTTTELDLSKVEVGVYMVRVFNENADKTFRVVKN